MLAFQASAQKPDDLVGKPVDIAPSAYRFRSDRKPDANDPESWLALKHVAGLPLNEPVDLANPAIRRALCGFLWEEIRPLQELKLTWAAGTRIPPPESLQVHLLVNHGSSSSWWNNLDAVPLDQKPAVTENGKTYVFPLGRESCGLVVSLRGDLAASSYDMPDAQVLVPDTWKEMDLEVEWGYEAARAGLDYSGHLETYDGRVGGLQRLAANTAVAGTNTWTSTGGSANRRGIRFSLLYMGTSKWRRRQEFTSQADDVARTIVTIWTRSGSFSFLAADLENGPILAPEYGFFVRRTSPLAPSGPPAARRVVPVPFVTRMASVVGDSRLKGWGSDDTPIVAANSTTETVSAKGITFPTGAVAMHPGRSVDVLTQWRSPLKGQVSLSATLTHAQKGSNGIEWWIVEEKQHRRTVLTHGVTDGQGSHSIRLDRSIEVEPGDSVSLIIGPKGDYTCDTTLIDWTLTEVGGLGRSWNLAKDVAGSLQGANPHPDGFGNAGVWRFCYQDPMLDPGSLASEPPIKLDSNAKSAKEYLAELASRGLQTIREKTRLHAEQTWKGAVTATRGTNLPPHPAAPETSLPPMQVKVPSQRLTAQWNLGVWHLVRHCGVNPQTGRLWFNDYPYGILAAETYLVLHVLDLMGAGDAAADGYDQWLSLPLERDHPVGLFSEGKGALTYAVGPDGYGGNMDGIHAFGAGSIGWALTQHYRLTGDKSWLIKNASRMAANAEWMLRQRKVITDSVPGGERLWCKGLQPALQVTPDSGGLWMQFYECEAYYWSAVDRLADVLADIDPAGGARLKKEADAYRKDLRTAVERSIALSPVVPVRDGTYHSVIPFACYVRGLATGAWGWNRDGSGTHVGPLYWDTVQTAAALVSPAGLLPADDVRVQGYLDVLEDRLLLENKNVGDRDWFMAGWQYQTGLERTANMHLAADGIPEFLRSMLNGYAVDILPDQGYTFNEHAVHGPPDKIFEEAAFLERFRNLLVMEEGSELWLAKGTPRAWLEQGKEISVRNAPTCFGTMSYKITSDVDHGQIAAEVSIPDRSQAKVILLRLRHPRGMPMRSVTVNGRPWSKFDTYKEVVSLAGLKGTVNVVCRY
ncbi:MAG TPA: hypothetical protein VG944_07240 [Fimbriimonas sp.]|nr:hypothetical protein [Fimbriimonas sp.]